MRVFIGALRLLMFICLSLLLTGCGGGSSTGDITTPSSGSGTVAAAPTTGDVTVVTTIAANKAVPASTVKIRVSILNNGVLVTASDLTNPSEFPTTPGTTQTNVVRNVPLGAYTVVVEAIDGTGLVLGANVSSLTVSVSRTAIVRVTSIESVSTVSVTPSTATVAAGGTQSLSATTTLADNSSYSVTAFGTWTSNATAVATVSNASGTQGTVTGVAGGTATVSCAYGGVSGSATVTVSGAAPGPTPTPSPTSVNVTATNLNRWTQTRSGLTLRDYAIDPVSKTAVVVGDGGFIASFDANGVMTVRAASGVSSTTQLNAVAWLGGSVNRFVVVGDAGTILSSPDGATWTRIPGGNNPTPIACNLLDVCAYTNGTSSGFVAVGTTDGVQGAIVTSTNGTSWTDISKVANNVNYTSVAFGLINTTPYVEILSDTAAQCLWQPLATNAAPAAANWTSTVIPHAGARCVTYVSTGSSQFFMACGDSGWVAANSNGQAWTSVGQISGAPNIKGVAYGKAGATDTLSFAGSSGSSPIVVVDNTFTDSTSGHTFVAGTAKLSMPNAPSYGGQLTHVRFGNGLFQATGQDGARLSSAGGKDYTSATYAPDVSVDKIALGTVNGAPLYVATGHVVTANPYGAFRPLVQTSPDGVTWTVRDPGALARPLTALCFGNGRFVALTDQGSIILSSDGVTWAPPPTTPTTTQGGYTAVAYGVVNGSGHFVAAGDGVISVSDANGDNWTAKNAGVFGIPGIAYGMVGSPATGIFVECGQDGEIAWSTDAATWTTVVTSKTNDLFDITFLNNTFVTVGAAGRIQTSTDGKTFTDRGTFGALALRGVTGVTTPNGASPFVGYVAVGDGGTVLTSNDAITWTSASSQTTTTQTLYTVAVGTTQSSQLNPQTNVTTITWTSLFVAGGTHNTVLTDH